MDPMSGFDIRLVFTLPPKDSIHCRQYKGCVHLWNNFPCISTLVPCSKQHHVLFLTSSKSIFFSFNIFFPFYVLQPFLFINKTKKHLHNLELGSVVLPPPRSCVDCIWTEEPLQLIIPLILSLLLQGWTWLMGNQDLQS